MNAGVAGEEEIIQPIGNGIVEEGGNAEESFRYKVYALYKDLELEIVREVDCCKIGNRQDDCHQVPYARVMPYTDVFKVIVLLDGAE